MARHDGYRIHTGFLAGNLFSDAGDDGGTYDETASAHRYAEMLQAKLEAAYPGAAVEVEYALDTSGALTWQYQTWVGTPDGHSYEPGTLNGASMLAARVQDLCQALWEGWEWVVYAAE